MPLQMALILLKSMEALCLSWYDLGMVNSRWLTELVLLSEAHGDTKYLMYAPVGTLNRGSTWQSFGDIFQNIHVCVLFPNLSMVTLQESHDSDVYSKAMEG